MFLYFNFCVYVSMTGLTKYVYTLEIYFRGVEMNTTILANFFFAVVIINVKT